MNIKKLSAVFMLVALFFVSAGNVSAVDTLAPAVPTSFSVKAGDTESEIVLNWTNPRSSDLSHINVYLVTSSAYSATSVHGSIDATSGTAGTATLFNMGFNTTHYIYLSAVDTSGNVSGFTANLKYSTALAPTEASTSTPTPFATTTIPPAGSSVVAVLNGDLIRASGTQDVYLVKIVGVKKFKRLILNPEVFNFYDSMNWADVKDVSLAVAGEYTTSDLVIEANVDGSIASPRVYKLSSGVDSDVGQKQWLNMTPTEFEAQGHDWDAIYKINSTEASADFYLDGSDITIS